MYICISIHKSTAAWNIRWHHATCSLPFVKGRNRNWERASAAYIQTDIKWQLRLKWCYKDLKAVTAAREIPLFEHTQLGHGALEIARKSLNHPRFISHCCHFQRTFIFLGCTSIIVNNDDALDSVAVCVCRYLLMCWYVLCSQIGLFLICTSQVSGQIAGLSCLEWFCGCLLSCFRVGFSRIYGFQLPASKKGYIL